MDAYHLIAIAADATAAAPEVLNGAVVSVHDALCGYVVWWLLVNFDSRRERS